MHTYIHTYIHTVIHSHINTYIQRYIRTYIHTYLHTYIHTYRHTFVHTHIHTDMHTYIHIHTHSFDATPSRANPKARRHSTPPEDCPHEALYRTGNQYVRLEKSSFHAIHKTDTSFLHPIPPARVFPIGGHTETVANLARPQLRTVVATSIEEQGDRAHHE